MGVHLIPLAAFHISRGGAGVATPRLLATLIWPYLIKICLSLKVSPHDLITSSRFLLFQLSQIFLHDVPTDNDNNNNNDHGHGHGQMASINGNSRWDRGLRLVRDRVAQSRQVGRHFPSNDEESLHLLSMLAL